MRGFFCARHNGRMDNKRSNARPRRRSSASAPSSSAQSPYAGYPDAPHASREGYPSRGSRAAGSGTSSAPGGASTPTPRRGGARDPRDPRAGSAPAYPSAADRARSGSAYRSDRARSGVADDPTARRLSRDEYARTHQHKRRGKLRYVLIAVLAVAVIGVGSAFAYYSVLSNNLHAGLGDVGKYLVKSDMTREPFYMLLMGTDKSADREASGETDNLYRTDSIMLVRIDPVNNQVALVSLPRDTLVDMGEYGEGKLNSAYTYGGPSLAVQTVSKLANVDISHYAEIDFDGFRDIVNALGGVEVDVPMEIDDADAGGHLDAGLQTLNGDQALILCRARHAYDEVGAGDEYRAANQRLVLSAIAQKLLSADVVTLATTVQTLSQYVTTDLGVTDIIALAQAMQGLDASTGISSATAPTTSEYIDDLWYEVIDEDDWNTMMTRVDEGLSPTEGDVVDEVTGTILASSGSGGAGSGSDDDAGDGPVQRSGSVAVRNGNGVTGAGTDAAQDIQALGYSVNTSNADSFDYPQTIVVYDDASQKSAAEEIASAIGVGKAVQNDGSYLFDADFLVVLGADWQ